MAKRTPEEIQADWTIVLSLGGPARVAELLRYERDGGVQRVQNWKERGIPADVKLSRPDLFLRGLRASRARREVQQRAA